MSLFSKRVQEATDEYLRNINDEERTLRLANALTRIQATGTWEALQDACVILGATTRLSHPAFDALFPDVVEDYLGERPPRDSWTYKIDGKGWSLLVIYDWTTENHYIRVIPAGDTRKKDQLLEIVAERVHPY